MVKKFSQIDKGQMRRELGLSDLFAVGYGDLGSSIYYALGITALYALGATPVALMLAGLVFVCTALTYAEMSSVVPEAGGSASFSRKAFNDLISFIAGWGLLLDYIVTIAISSYAIAPYLAHFFDFLQNRDAKIGLTLVAIAFLIGLNIRGSKHSTRLSIVLTFLTVITQIVIIVIGGLTLVNLPEFISHLRINGADKLWSPTWTQFIHGVAIAMVAYTGIESMAQLSAEAKNPSKTVPRAIVLAMGTLLFLYFGVSIVALSGMTPQTLSTKYVEDPIAGIVTVLPFGGEILAPWVGLLAAIILLVAANAGLIGASRLSFNMGENIQLPQFFYKLHPRLKTPYRSLILFGVLAGAIVVWSRGNLEFLAYLYNFGAMMAFFFAHLSLIAHRIRYPKFERPFKISFNIRLKGREIPVTGLIGAIATFSVWILTIVTKPEGRYLGFTWITIGLILYFAYRKRKNLSPVAQVEIEKIKIEDYKEAPIKKVLLPTRGHLSTDTVVVGCNLAKLYNAEITVVHVVEVSYMLPISTSLLQRETYSEAVLKRAQAIGHDKGVKMKVKTIRARSVVKAIVELIEQGDYDLLILGSRNPQSLGPVTEKILQEVKCRVWICRQSMDQGGDERDSLTALHEAKKDHLPDDL